MTNVCLLKPLEGIYHTQSLGKQSAALELARNTSLKIIFYIVHIVERNACLCEPLITDGTVKV